MSAFPVRIPPEKNLPMPPVSAALGMASSYYVYPKLISAPAGQYYFFVLLSLFVLLICFLRVLSYFPVESLQAVYRKTISHNTVYSAGILVIAAAVGFSFGIAARRTVVSPPEIGFQPEKITAVSGVLIEDPRSLQSGPGMGILKLNFCAAQGALRASARGSITVLFPAESIPRLREFGRGCEIYADGVYTEGSRGPLFRASSVHIVKGAPALEQFRTSLRMKLLERFKKPAVWGSLASALLLGVRDDLEVDLLESFRDSGCAHILALSGMHLAVISAILAFLLRRPLGIRWASLFGAIFIIFYVFAAGSQPSLVRSAIMYLIGTLCLWGFLKRKALTLLGLAFIIQLTFQSETGISLSFILSYLALLGILTMGESFHKLFRGRLPEIFSRLLSTSLGAFILTSPVVAFYFGSLRPIGIIAGLLVIPLSSLFMILALVALVVSFLPLPLWGFFDFVLTVVYRIIEFLVSISGRVPGLSVSNPVPVLIVTIFLWLFILFIQRRDEARRSSIASLD